MWQELYKLKSLIDTLQNRIRWLEESFDERTSAYKDLIEYLRLNELKTLEIDNKETKCIPKTAQTPFPPPEFF